MKILKKTIALFLVVVLAASAFCLEAFAASRYKSGSFSGYYWEATLNVGTFSSKTSIAVNAPAGKTSVRVYGGVWYYDAKGLLHSIGNSSTGTRAASVLVGDGHRVANGRGGAYINNTEVVSFGYVEP